MNPKVDHYLAEGCGRCPLGGTPRCKVRKWPELLETLREILLDSGLEEELKWGVPCYTYQSRNILIMSAFKEYCAISFFKGSLMRDPHVVFFKPGEHSQATRQLRFTGMQEVIKLEPILKAYVREAIEVEKAGLKVPFMKTSEFPVPEEFQIKLDEIPALRTAFYALTPGRQRGYLLYFSQAKQSGTRVARIEKWIPHIFEGKGINDR